MCYLHGASKSSLPRNPRVMPIEFRCSGCDKLLRVPDEFAGRQAQCPQCETVLPVPSENDEPTAAPDPAPAAPASPVVPESGNPFQSPLADSATKPAASTILPTEVNVSTILSQTWAIFKNNWGLTIGGFFVSWLLSNFVSYGVGFSAAILGEQIGEAGTLLVFLAQLFAIGFGIFITLGQTQLFLNLAKGQPANLNDLFSCGRFLGIYIGASVIFGLGIAGGLILLIIPGIILALMWLFYTYTVIDAGGGITSSLTQSAEITKGNKRTLALLMACLAGIQFLGLLACGVGLLVSAPYAWLAMAVAYTMMSGQAVAQE